jgi:hypothetical protein
MNSPESISAEWVSHLEDTMFPCVAAKASLVKEQQKVFIADHIACPKDDRAILDFIYTFVDSYRQSDSPFNSAAIIFRQPTVMTEVAFDQFFWQRLQALSNLDSEKYAYDSRVSADPSSENFSFSLKSEAFFVIGLHPASSRPARKFKYPTIVFNPHAQFEKLRELRQFEKMKNIIRKRDTALAGDINPMLTDFGTASEVYQYTGQRLTNNWTCPLHINHGSTKHHRSA